MNIQNLESELKAAEQQLDRAKEKVKELKRLKTSLARAIEHAKKLG